MENVCMWCACWENLPGRRAWHGMAWHVTQWIGFLDFQRFVLCLRHLPPPGVHLTPFSDASFHVVDLVGLPGSDPASGPPSALGGIQE